MACNLAKPDEIPSAIRTNLARHGDVFRRVEFLDELLEKKGELLDIARDLNAVCRAHGVVGYHYTRSFRERIATDGLLARSGKEWRQEFLDRFGELFSIAQRQRLQRGWGEYFDSNQNGALDGRVCFALTKAALKNGGATALLDHYGGEVIYMPFTRDKEIAAILHSIGESMIVECALDTSRLSRFSGMPWGKVWLSTYHCSVNPGAHQQDYDVFSSSSIPASDVIAIQSIDHGEF